MQRWLLLLFPLVLLSCKKNNVETIPTTQFNIPDVVDIQQLYVVNASTLFAVGGKRNAYGKVYKSIDGGATWETQTLSNSENLYAIHFQNDSVGFAGGGFSSLFRTVDGGANWAQYYFDATELPYHEVHRPAIRRFDFHGQQGYFVGGENYETGTVYHTSDGGMNWQFDTLRHELRGLHFFDASTGMASGYGYLAHTSDSGKTWNRNLIEGEFFTAVELLSTHEAIACGYNGGLYHTKNSGTDWAEVEKSNGVYGRRKAFNDVNFYTITNGYAVGNNGIVMQTKDGGKNWEELQLDTDQHLKHIAIHGDFAYVAGESGTIFRFQTD